MCSVCGLEHGIVDAAGLFNALNASFDNIL